MSTHAAYIAGAFGIAFLAVALELLWLAKRGRQRHAQSDNLDDAP
ncbi:heme exporter protein CcmD [Cupriavidus pauculus]|nr:heme exporter protein CcmD [Cupriavidus pauculus]GJG97276.1 hypothetical protein CBA19C6_22325 [Cupriavidus pauculus]